MGGFTGRIVTEPGIVLEPDAFFDKAVRRTYEHLIETVNLASETKDMILMQTLQGRAINGQWSPDICKHYVDFGQRRYPNTTLEDVFCALGYDVGSVQSARQDIINAIIGYFDRVIEYLYHTRNGHANDYVPRGPVFTMLDMEGRPLGGIQFFYGNAVSNLEAVLAGGYIGSCMDSAYWRKKTEEKFRAVFPDKEFTMHKGECRAVHMARMKENGLTIADLARLRTNGKHTLQELIDLGIISDNERVRYDRGYSSGFVEIESGYGISDDAALMGAALEFGEDGSRGLLLLDAVDTWDKSTPKIVKGGQDEALGQRIKERYERHFGPGSFPCTDDDVMNVIYLGAIDDTSQYIFPSCSQRRFVDVDPVYRMTAIQSHLLWCNYVVQNSLFPAMTPPPSMKLAVKRVSTSDFYPAFKERYLSVIGIKDQIHLRNAYRIPNGNGGNGAAHSASCS